MDSLLPQRRVLHLILSYVMGNTLALQTSAGIPSVPKMTFVELIECRFGSKQSNFNFVNLLFEHLDFDQKRQR